MDDLVLHLENNAPTDRVAAILVSDGLDCAGPDASTLCETDVTRQQCQVEWPALAAGRAGRRVPSPDGLYVLPRGGALHPTAIRLYDVLSPAGSQPALAAIPDCRGAEPPTRCPPETKRDPTTGICRRTVTLDCATMMTESWGSLAWDERFPSGSVFALGNEQSAWCSGALVAPDVIATARHCIPVTHAWVGRRVRGASRVAIAEVALPNEETWDVALVRLSTALHAHSLPFRGPNDRDAPYGDVVAIGYGARDSDGLHEFGERHVIPMTMSGWGCDGPRDASIYGCTPGLEAAVTVSAADTCDGDSGGPLLELVRTGVIGVAGRAGSLEIASTMDGTETVDPDALAEHLTRLTSDHDADEWDLNASFEMCEWRVAATTSRPLRNASVRCGEGGIYVRTDTTARWMRGVLRNWGYTDEQNE